MSASSSGNQTVSWRAPLSSSKKTDGLPAFSNAFSSSPMTRSLGSASTLIVAASYLVSSATAKSKRAANCAARNTLSGSSTKLTSFT